MQKNNEDKKTVYPKVNPKQSFPEIEEQMLAFWKENKTFEKSIENRKDNSEFNFYDGPPFATGTPHYGHILAGTLKDVVPRYQTMKGHRVDRKFGWDCHGLPIENIVEKKLGISGREDIENKVGVHEFNEQCRSNVFGYVDDWKKIVERMGRWVDMENSYKTMDAPFMESVWWVYKKLYDKGLIYEGYRVVPYCPRCSTPLSNFEVNQGYKDKQDKSITVKFKVKGSENKYILAWTTTPWTLMSNLGLAVGADIDYVELKDNNNKQTYVIAKDRLSSYYKKEEDYVILREYKGECLVGIKYEAVFPDFGVLKETSAMPSGMELGENAYSVVLGHHVTTESGTGIVHIAPAYGEDDYQIGKDQKLGFVSHIGDTGKLEHTLNNDKQQVFEYNEVAIQELKTRGDIVKIETIDHSYPHCWRCDSPLIYRAISAWYVKVEDIRDKMVENNKKINWVPGAIKTGRFGKWIENARDWNISRNRYWGSAIPVWQNEDKSEEVCIGSVEELYNLNKDFGQIEKKADKYYFADSGKEFDLHKHFVDNILVKNPKGKKAKNVLGVHGRISVIEKSTSWPERIKTLEERGVNIDVPQFDNSEDPTYESWKETFDKQDFSKYDTMLAVSLGGAMVIKYILDNQIKLDRLVMVAPGVANGLDTRPNLKKFYEDLYKENLDLTGLVKEIVVIHSKDDDKVSFESGKFIAEKTGAKLIEVDEYGHLKGVGVELICTLVEYGTPLQRIPEVLDCWFESGSMPYASKHYPFENDEAFKFPGDFIAEGIDQTRGWFYTLLILGTALFDDTPFLNVIVNGTVLADDGRKMSKSLQNYPDPQLIFDKYGADAMRFYMMNSPVVEAQDFRFSESGVEEVVKKTILPLWNTFYFFTTYANIDEFRPNENSNVYFMRHGQTTNNVAGKMSGGDDDANLTEKGIQQAIEAGQNFKATGVKLDKIIVTSRQRAKDTATNFIKGLGYDVEIEQRDEFNEQLSGKFLNYSHDDIKKEYNVNSTYEIRKIFKYKKYNEVEDITEFEKRVLDGYNKLKDDYKGKNVLIVGHSGTFRPINKVVNNLSSEQAYFAGSSSQNVKVVKIPNYTRHNELDKWIISQLHDLIKEVETGFDSYKLADSARPIVKFMDNLTNWYIRRSRKRFWKSENDGDKMEAYNTLYEVLVELTKVIAPFMPFVSEYVFKSLTGKTSVHLENFPDYIPGYIMGELNKQMDKTQKIINLGLAWRVNNKLRVRQPVASISIGEDLGEYYKEIIAEELNVKEVIILEDTEQLAKKICKPNAKLLGPKFGKDMKFIMNEAKGGNFEELEGGQIKVGEFILEKGEYEIAFEKKDETLNIEAGYGMVIAMDDKITPQLKAEGNARDIVRFIQDARKEADYLVDDRIEISLEGSIVEEIKDFVSYIEAETLSTVKSSLESFDLEKKVEIEGGEVVIRLKK